MDETQYDRFWTHFQLFGKRDARADATTRHHSARKACRGFGLNLSVMATFLQWQQPQTPRPVSNGQLKAKDHDVQSN